MYTSLKIMLRIWGNLKCANKSIYIEGLLRKINVDFKLICLILEIFKHDLYEGSIRTLYFKFNTFKWKLSLWFLLLWSNRPFMPGTNYIKLL